MNDPSTEIWKDALAVKMLRVSYSNLGRTVEYSLLSYLWYSSVSAGKYLDGNYFHGMESFLRS
jgi:hypothetical protein